MRFALSDFRFLAGIAPCQFEDIGLSTRRKGSRFGAAHAAFLEALGANGHNIKRPRT